jgi:hypothetical protein
VRIIAPVVGDSAGDFLHNLYFRAIEKNETIVTNFNGVTIIFCQDESGFEHLSFPSNIDVVKAHYLRELDRDDPTGYSEIERYEKQFKKYFADLKRKNKELNDRIENARGWSKLHCSRDQNRTLQRLLTDKNSIERIIEGDTKYQN